MNTAWKQFDALRKLVKVPGYCCGPLHTEQEAFNITLSGELDKLLTQRDYYYEMVDKLAYTIAWHLDINIGEHSSDNDPWHNALRAVEKRADNGHRYD